MTLAYDNTSLLPIFCSRACNNKRMKGDFVYQGLYQLHFWFSLSLLMRKGSFLNCLPNDHTYLEIFRNTLSDTKNLENICN